MRIVYLFCLFTFFQCASSKTTKKVVEGNPHKKEIIDTLDNYMAKFKAGDYASMLDLTYPKLFEIAPKEAMLEILEQTFDSEEIKISISDSEILKVYDKLVTRGDTLYTIVDYKMKMHMKLNADMADAVEFMIPEFNKQFGADNVEFVDDTNTFNIKLNSQMVAIRVIGNWYFLENKKTSDDRFILEKSIGKEVLAELGI